MSVMKRGDSLYRLPFHVYRMTEIDQLPGDGYRCRRVIVCADKIDIPQPET